MNTRLENLKNHCRKITISTEIFKIYGYNLIKGIYTKTSANITLNGDILNALPPLSLPKVRNKARVSALTTLIQPQYWKF